jgi:hypothetical protein
MKPILYLPQLFARNVRQHLETNIMRRHTLAAISLTSVLLMTGCAGLNSGSPAAPVSLSVAGLHGKVHGGQQPISNATIQLWQVGTTGYGMGAMPLIAATVLTGPDGSFNITGDYSCTSGTQVYITAIGGDPGAGTNTAAANMAGLGLCDVLGPSTFISMDETTTVGAVWALSPFMNGTNVGAPLSNQAGLASAFADISQIVDNSQGSTPGPALPITAVAPTTEINTLADLLAACINSEPDLQSTVRQHDTLGRLAAGRYDHRRGEHRSQSGQ